MEDREITGIRGNAESVGTFNVEFNAQSTDLEYEHFVENIESFTKIHDNTFNRLGRQMTQKGKYKGNGFPLLISTYIV